MSLVDTGLTNIRSIYSNGKGRATAVTAARLTPNLDKRSDIVAKRICSVEDCGRGLIAQGLCSMHYQRGKADGSISNLPPRGKCSVDDCDREAQRIREWCEKHWRLVQKYGKPESPARAKVDTAWLESIEVPAGTRAVPVLISLQDGFTHAIVDDADYADVSQWRWKLSRGGYAHRAVNKDGKSAWLYMHRFIMGSPDGLEIDHINRTKLDNRRCNLRAVDRSLNSFNQAPNRRNTSGHKGVGYFKPANLWRAYISHKSQPKRIELGYFKTKEEAIAARKAAEERYFGECA